MSEEEIGRLIQMNQRQSLLLGHATAIFFLLEKHIPADKRSQYIWFKQALNNLYYLDKPFPPMP